ncbi:MAG TPA: nucleoside monophosphate kinase [Candidatus Saccharimonadales bacterium]|nr:nucleoside monophosphate kinase [Candidatus Saccharimonadales bacterium]
MIIFFGPAGSGKSLQGQILAARQGWLWLSSGQMLRDSKDTELHKIMQTGKLVSTEKIEEIIGDALEKIEDKDKLILDGFPRKLDQAEWMVEKGLIHGNSKDLIVIVDVSEDVLVERFLGRGRDDDMPASVERRLRIYNEESPRIFDYFANQNIKTIRIDGSGKVGQIHDDLMKVLSVCKLV